jgi:hypothetical protein
MTKIKSLLAVSLLAMSVISCSTFGKNPSPPTAFESKLFVIQTNFVPVIVTKTNVENKINVITITNSVGVILWQTNQVTVTNSVSETNEVPNYTYGQSDAGKTIAQTTGAIVNGVAPGFGGIAGTGIMAILSLWAYLRGSKFKTTSVTIAQEVETMREFLKTLPQGAKYDQAIVSFLQSHQMETGTAQQVLSLVNNEVSNPEAQAAVKEIQDALAALSKS